MKFELKPTSQFEKDVKSSKKRGKDLDKLFQIIGELGQGNPLLPKNKDHNLTGEYFSFRECHIEPDWLLIYKIYKDENVLMLTRTGSHSDLFG